MNESARIVLFLGSRNKAHEAVYIRENRLDPSPQELLLPWKILLADAMDACPGRVVQVVVIGGKSTWEGWEQHLPDDARRAGYDDRKAVPIAFLPYDEETFTPNERPGFWTFFDQLRLAVGGEPLADRTELLLVRGSPREAFSVRANYVAVDITRGFRAAPFIGASALAFVQAADRRHSVKDSQHQPIRHRIYYAADDSTPDVTTPVWDLTPFVESVDLSDALDAFARHGRADDLGRFFENSQNQAANDLAKAMQQFSADLLLMRIPNLLRRSAPTLQRALTESLDALKQAFPPVCDDIDNFKKQIDDLVPNGASVNPVSLPGLKATSVLAQRLWDTGRYAELYNLLRESLLTAFTVLAVDGKLYQPGIEEDDGHKETESERENAGLFKRQRDAVENTCKVLLQQSCLNERPKSSLALQQSRWGDAENALKQLSEIRDRRNDVAHCSMRPRPKKEGKLRDDLKLSLDAFKTLVDSLFSP